LNDDAKIKTFLNFLVYFNELRYFYLDLIIFMNRIVYAIYPKKARPNVWLNDRLLEVVEKRKNEKHSVSVQNSKISRSFLSLNFQ
jgi:hypothetical protein